MRLKRWMISLIFLSLLISGCISNTQPTPAPPLTGKTDISRALLAQHSNWQGTPYRLGGVDRQGIDCSAFTKLTYRQLFNIHLPRTTEAQAYYGESISKSHLRPGDLVLFKTVGGKQRHVGIYLQEDTFVHASTSKGVTLSKLSNPYWQQHYWKAIRPAAMSDLQRSL